MRIERLASARKSARERSYSKGAVSHSSIGASVGGSVGGSGMKEHLKEDIYISGYWKIGLIEDEHQAQKRLET